MSKGLVFGGGIPTEIDVNALMDCYGAPAPGAMIPYEKISELIGVRRDENRWRTIVTAWRRRLEREHNLLLRAVKGEGFEVMDGSARVAFAASTYKGGLRRVARAAAVAAKTSRQGLSEDEAKVCDHLQRVGATIRLTAATEARKLKYPLPEPQPADMEDCAPPRPNNNKELTHA